MYASGIGGSSVFNYIAPMGQMSPRPGRREDRQAPPPDSDASQRPAAPGSDAAVKLQLSPDAQKLMGVVNGQNFYITTKEKEESDKADATYQRNGKTSKNSKSSSPKGTSDGEKEMIRELQKRDTEVKAHEAAHLAAAGGLAKGGPKFDYQTGPDGKQYAVGGHVEIDTSPIAGDPEATLAKAQKLRQAALGVSDPSSADMGVAMAATEMAMKAQSDVGRKNSLDSHQATRASDPTSFGAGGMAAHVENVYSTLRVVAKGSFIRVTA